MNPWMSTRDRQNGTLRPLLTFSVLCICPFLGQGQSQNVPKSPKEVLQAYRKMDGEGARLSDSGWYSASRFFIHPERPPQDRVIGVMTGGSVPDIPVTGHQVHAIVRCWALGQIDPSARFVAVIAPYLVDGSGHLSKLPADVAFGPDMLMMRYTLALTGTHWEFGAGRDGPHEVSGPPEWRIEDFELVPWVTVDVAIRHLTHIRESSRSPAVKANAEKSIAAIRRASKRR